MQHRIYYKTLFVGLAVCFGLLIFCVKTATAQNDVRLNKQPFLDLGNKVRPRLAEKKLDLSKSVDVKIESRIDSDGKFVGAPKIVSKAENDPVLQEIAIAFVMALNDSEMLRYLKPMSEGADQRQMSIRIFKDDKQVSVQIVSDLNDENKARRNASGLNLLIGLAGQMRKGKEEGELLDKIRVTTDKGQVIFEWLMDTPTFMEILKKKLTEIEKQ